MDNETAMQLVEAVEKISSQLACVWGIWVALVIIMLILMVKR